VKRRILALATLTVILATLALQSGFSLPRKPSAVSRCPQEALVVKNTNNGRIHPQKVVVRPWKGRHQVYGVFVLPNEYQANNAVVVNIEGISTYCGGKPIPKVKDEFQGVYAQPGERIVVAYFRTRTASWLIAQGRMEELKQPRNWLLSIQKGDT